MILFFFCPLVLKPFYHLLKGKLENISDVRINQKIFTSPEKSLVAMKVPLNCLRKRTARIQSLIWRGSRREWLYCTQVLDPVDIARRLVAQLSLEILLQVLGRQGEPGGCF